MKKSKYIQKKYILRTAFVLLLFSIVFVNTALAVSDEPGQIPQVGNITAPSTTSDLTSNLGIFADMGKFILEYAVQIAVFIMVLAVVALSLRGSWARSNNKVDDAVEAHKNTKGLIDRRYTDNGSPSLYLSTFLRHLLKASFLHEVRKMDESAKRRHD